MIAPGVFALICLAGGIGAALRFLIDGLVKNRFALSYPLGTTLINVSGSLGLGILTGSAASAGLPHDWLLVLGGGLMGGYTTFSTASFETFRLAQARRWGAMVANGLGMLVVTVAAAGLGLVIGSAL